MPDDSRAGESINSESQAGEIADQSESLSRSSEAGRFSLRTLFLIVTVAAAILAAFSTLFRRHEADQAANTERNIKSNIKTCLWRAYGGIDDHRRYGHGWPPRIPTDSEGQQIQSWRLFIVPDLSFFKKYYDYDSPPYPDRKSAWNSSKNRVIARNLPNPFSALSEDADETNVFAITGSDTGYDLSATRRFLELPASLILFMEVADTKTHWMQPGDYGVTKLLAATGPLGDTVKGLLPDRIHVLFADGEVWALSPDAPIDAVKPFFTITGAKTASREKSLSKYRVDE